MVDEVGLLGTQLLFPHSRRCRLATLLKVLDSLTRHLCGTGGWRGGLEAIGTVIGIIGGRLNPFLGGKVIGTEAEATGDAAAGPRSGDRAVRWTLGMRRAIQEVRVEGGMQGDLLQGLGRAGSSGAGWNRTTRTGSWTLNTARGRDPGRLALVIRKVVGLGPAGFLVVFPTPVAVGEEVRAV